MDFGPFVAYGASPVKADKEAKEAKEYDQQLEGMVAEIESRLARFSDPDAARRRLRTLLGRPEANATGKRLTLRAQKIASQGGVCPACRWPFGPNRKPSMRLSMNEPVLCKVCERAEMIRKIAKARVG